MNGKRGHDLNDIYACIQTEAMLSTS